MASERILTKKKYKANRECESCGGKSEIELHLLHSAFELAFIDTNVNSVLIWCRVSKKVKQVHLVLFTRHEEREGNHRAMAIAE